MRNLALVEIKELSKKEICMSFKDFKAFCIEIIEDQSQNRFIKMYYKYFDRSQMRGMRYLVITRYLKNALDITEYLDTLESYLDQDVTPQEIMSKLEELGE
jgi:hypothetical protein